MSFHQLSDLHYIPADLDTVWNFISRPENLKVITPADLGFEIVTQDLPELMYPGMIIEYRVTPIAGLRQRWVTEITHIREKEYFVDEQRVGPYAMWHHEHAVEAVSGGVKMKDTVSYKLPLGPLGEIAHILFVRRQLNAIFEYRRKALNEHFGIFEDVPGSVTQGHSIK